MKGFKYAAIFAVMAVAAWSLAGCGIPKSEYEKMEKKYATVQREIKSFNTQAKKIQQDNEVLKKKNTELNQKIKKVTREQGTVEKKNQELVKEKKELQEKLNEAQTQAQANAQKVE